jgi:hypothetical protein
MTGAQGTDGTPYTGAETIYLNGEFLGWWGWGAPGPTNYALTKVGATDVHTITLPVVAGDSLALNYKYSIGGADNEAGQQTNHVRYIRPAAGVTNYTLPQDVWINSNPGVPRVEPEIGGLVARPFAPGSVTLDWSGLPCTWMQGSTNVAGPWTPLFEARGVASTNMTLVGEQMFFRLAR